MTRNNILKLVGVITLVVLLVGYFFWKNNFSENGQFNQIVIRRHVFKAEVITTQEKKEKGLGGRKSICGDCGMLFVFDKAGKYAFWMKDMQFALDILWIKDGKINFIEKNVQPSFPATMTPSENSNQVLELNAGTIDRLGITIGDEVLWTDSGS